MDSRVEGAREFDVERMAGLARLDVAGQRPSEKGKVTDEVKDLVAHELVTETQGSRDDALVIQHDGVVEVSAASEAARPHRLDVAGDPEGPGGSDPGRVLLGTHRQGQRLPTDDRMREIDLVGDRQARPVRREDDAAVAARDLDAPVNHDRPHAGVLSLEAGGVKEADERESRAVQDRDFRSVDLDRAVVEALAGGGGEQVLDGADRNPARGQGRRVIEGRGGRQPRGDDGAGAIETGEDEAVARRRGTEMSANGMARMESDTLDRNASAESRLSSQTRAAF